MNISAEFNSKNFFRLFIIRILKGNSDEIALVILFCFILFSSLSTRMNDSYAFLLQHFSSVRKINFWCLFEIKKKKKLHINSITILLNCFLWNSFGFGETNFCQRNVQLFRRLIPILVSKIFTLLGGFLRFSTMFLVS